MPLNILVRYIWGGSWRPFFKDVTDDLVLEMAIELENEVIVICNKKYFAGVNKFGIEILSPKELLEKRGLLI